MWLSLIRRKSTFYVGFFMLSYVEVVFITLYKCVYINVYGTTDIWRKLRTLCVILSTSIYGQYYHNQMGVEMLATSRHNITLDPKVYEEFAKTLVR